MPPYAHCPSLTGRTVLASGGATSIDVSRLEQFAEQGARVGFIDIDIDAAAGRTRRLGVSVERLVDTQARTNSCRINQEL